MTMVPDQAIIALQFDMRREDVLALNREYYRTSPATRRMRSRVRVTLPVILLAFWIFSTHSHGFDATTTVTHACIALLWFFLYPLRFDRNVMRNTGRLLEENSFTKLLGPCELVLSEGGLRSSSAMGESAYPWSSVESSRMLDDHLMIFLAGGSGYPIPIAQIGIDRAREAHEYALRHMAR